MTKSLKIKILAENTVYSRKVLAEHGLSFYFDYDGKKYLFDTGQGEVLVSNAEKMNINLKEIDTVFLSHGHDDHTGGLKEFLKLAPDTRVFAHSEVFTPKYKKVDGELKFIGLDLDKSDINNFTAAENNPIAASGIYSTGEIAAPKESYLKERYRIKTEAGEEVDPFDDDTSIYIHTESGIVILLGCSHKGVKNIIEDIRAEIGEQKIAAILGGMHLKRASKKEIEQLIDYFQSFDFDLLAPMHCTGRLAAVKFKEAFGERVNLASVGDSFEF